LLKGEGRPEIINVTLRRSAAVKRGVGYFFSAKEVESVGI